MPPSNTAPSATLFERANLYYTDLPDALIGLLKEFSRDQGILDCILTLDSIGTLVMARAGEQFTYDWLNGHIQAANPALYDIPSDDGRHRVDEAVRAVEWISAPAHYGAQTLGMPPHRAVRTRSIPLLYAGAQQGLLYLRWPGTPDREGAFLTFATEIAQQSAFLAKRYEMRQWAERQGHPASLLIGLSAPMRAVDRFLEKAARSPLPVLLTGEFGTETTAVAVMVHGLGQTPNGPFVHIHGSEPRGEPADWVARAASGALFISEIEALSPGFQSQLLHHMPARLGRGQAGESNRATAPVRLLAATTIDLKQAAREGRFSRSLLSELDFLGITLPPLRDRPEDLPALIAAALADHGYLTPGIIAPDLLQACRAYTWPENGFELERIIARLAVMTGGAPITHADIANYAPWILPAIAPEAEEVSPSVDGPAPSAVLTPPQRSTPLDHWVACALTKDASALANRHPALRKALFYLGEQYAQPVSMDELASHAHVSRSHLSFLFRTELQTSFKTLLGRLRVHKASELLSTDLRQPITEVAMSVGFADLSHFEKSFRRYVGKSPREFRRDSTTPSTPIRA